MFIQLSSDLNLGSKKSRYGQATKNTAVKFTVESYLGWANEQTRKTYSSLCCHHQVQASGLFGRQSCQASKVYVKIWSHSIVVNIGACHASVESSILSGTAKFSRCCLQRPCYKFRVEALISQDSQFTGTVLQVKG